MKPKVPHPGSECCDPATDLAGWVARQRAALRTLWDQASELHKLGKQLKAESITECIAGNSKRSRALLAQSDNAHLRGNLIGQDALICQGQVDRVEQAHQYRLGAASAVDPARTGGEQG